MLWPSIIYKSVEGFRNQKVEKYCVKLSRKLKPSFYIVGFCYFVMSNLS